MKDETNKVRNKPLHIYLGSKIEQFVKEMSEYYGLTKPEMIRTALGRFYNGDYRKEAFGYQSGATALTGAKKAPGPKISTREQMVFALSNMTNDEVTEWIKTSGFMTKQEKEKFEWICQKSEVTGDREIYFKQKNLGPGSKNEGTIFDWPHFIAEVRKWYKDEAKAEKIKSQ